MKQQLYIFLIILCTGVAEAQVLWQENFDNLTLGNLSNDPTGTTSGQNNWYVTLQGPSVSEAVTQETGKGNVWTNYLTYSGACKGNQSSLQALWNNRTVGNNVQLFEYDCYLKDFGSDNWHNSSATVYTVNSSILHMVFDIQYNPQTGKTETKLILYLGNLQDGLSSITKNIVNPTNKWFTVKLYVDYNTHKLYLYIPALNILETGVSNINNPLDNFNLGTTRTATVVLHNGLTSKYDNVKISALKEVPKEVLSIESVLATQFTLYPNPATTVVNINSAENKPVSKVAVYDVAGKLLSTQSFNNETNIQLHTESLASGTYMLHIETAEGTAVKKLVKK